MEANNKLQNLTSSEIVKSTFEGKGIKAEILRAGQKPMVKELEEDSARKIIKRIILTTIFESGFGVEENKTEILIASVIKDIERDFALFSIDDIEIAFREGVRGEYGKFMGLSVITFYNWLKFHKQKKMDVEDQKRRSIHELPEAPLTDERRIALRKATLDAIGAKYERWKETGDFIMIDPGNVMYKALKEMDLLSIPTETKQQALQEAMNIMVAEEQAKGAGIVDPKKKERIKKEIAEIYQGGDQVTDTLVYSLAMTICLKEQFKQWVEMEEDVALLLFEAFKNYEK